MTTTKDPALYRQLSEPFETAADFDAACVAFAADVAESRARHRLPDVVYVVSGNVKDGDSEKPQIMWGHRGDSSKVAPMLHHTLRQRVRDEVNVLVGMIATKPEEEP